MNINSSLMLSPHNNTGQEKILQISTRARGARGSRKAKYQAVLETKADTITM